MIELVLVIMAYLIGSIPTAVIISKKYRILISEIMEVVTQVQPTPLES